MHPFRRRLRSLAPLVALALPAAGDDPLDSWSIISPATPDWNFGNGSWNQATFADNRWVAVSSGGIHPGIVTSPDGVHWSRAATYPSGDYLDVAWGDGTWVAAGMDGVIARSTDGLHWTYVPSGTTTGLRRLTHGGHRWFALGPPYPDVSTTVLTSTDALTWVQSDSNLTILVPVVQSLAYSSGLWMAVGSATNGAPTLAASTDGRTWETRDLPTGVSSPLLAADTDGVWALAGSVAPTHAGDPPRSALWKSAGGTSWERVQTDLVDYGITRLSHQGRTWLLAHDGGNDWRFTSPVWSSEDLIHWEPGTAPGPAGPFLLSEARWLAFFGQPMISVDPEHRVWNPPLVHPDREVAFGQGRWLGISNQSGLGNSTKPPLCESPDGVEWKLCPDHAADTPWPNSIDFANDVWVLGGTGLAVSPEGRRWQRVAFPSHSEPYVTKVRHTEGGWAALGTTPDSQPLLLTSDQGTEWTQHRLPSRIHAVDVMFEGSHWRLVEHYQEYTSEPGCCKGGYWLSEDPANPTTWTFAATSPELAVTALRIEHGLWLGLDATHPGVATRVRGRNWTERRVAFEGFRPEGIAVGAGRVMVVGVNATLVSEPLVSLAMPTPGRLAVRTVPGTPILIEASADLVHWQVVTDSTDQSPLRVFDLPQPDSAAHRFYRAQLP